MCTKEDLCNLKLSGSFKRAGLPHIEAYPVSLISMFLLFYITNYNGVIKIEPASLFIPECYQKF